MFKIPDNFWCRNLSNCLLKAIDKASDILMFDLPPNLQNCSLLETLYRIGLSFSLYILRFFFFYFFFFCCYRTCSSDIGHLLLFYCFWHSYTHTCRSTTALRRCLDSGCKYVSIQYTLVNVCVIREKRKKCKTCFAIIEKTVFHRVVYWIVANTFSFSHKLFLQKIYLGKI